jgi:hypothetical protein
MSASRDAWCGGIVRVGPVPALSKLVRVPSSPGSLLRSPILLMPLTATRLRSYPVP